MSELLRQLQQRPQSVSNKLASPQTGIRTTTMKMEVPKNIHTKAYVVARKGDPFVLHDIILDEVQPEEVLVEIEYTGICHTACLRLNEHSVTDVDRLT